MEVTLPNGEVIQGVPEGTPKNAIMNKAVQAGIASPDDFGEEWRQEPAFSAEVLDPSQPETKVRKAKPGTRNITLPNGEIIQDAPIEASKREIMDKAIQAGLAEPEDFDVPGLDKETSAWRQFRYGFESTPGLTQMGADILESHFPLGEISFDFTDGFQYASPDEVYGEEFMQADPETRREMIFAKRQEELDLEFGEGFEQEGVAGFAGEVAGGAADVTSLLPAGRTLRGMAATGGGLGGSYSVLQDLSQGEDVDPMKAAISTAASAILTPVPFMGARYVRNKASTKSAERLVNRAQKAINEKVDSGLPVTNPEAVLREKGIDPTRVSAAISNSGKKIRLPSVSSKAAQDAMASDSAVTRLYSKNLDKLAGSTTTRIRGISEPVFGRISKFEFDTHVDSQNALKTSQEFMRTVSKLPKGAKNRVSKALYNGDFDLAERTLEEYDPQVALKFEQTRQVLDSLGDQLKESGRDFTKIENYFPRVVRDVDGLLATMGKERRGIFEEALQKFAKARGIPVSSITPEDRTSVIDMVTRGYSVSTDGHKPRFVKSRTIDKVTDEQLQFYEDPVASLQKYIRGAVNDVNRRKFFGRSLAQHADGGTDVDLSVGKFIDDELQAGNLTPDKQQELLELLKSRFIGGEQTPSAFVSALKDAGYLSTIANPVSAVTQFGDASIAASLKGFRNAIGSLFGTKDLKMVDMGLENLISHEFDDSFLRNTLNKMFTASGFRAVDRLGKETFVNSAIKRARQQVRNPQGLKKFRERWGGVYGDEFENLVDDLKNGRVSDNVKLHAFTELADVQPVSLSSMPQAYLDNPNGRLLYMLKSFTMKQYDIARREVVQEWKRGNKLDATRNAALLGGYLAAANTGTQVVKDFMLGRDVKPEQLPDRALWALLGVYGLNKYTNERYLARGDISGAVANTLMPATPLIDAAFKLGTELPKDDPNIEPALRAIPYVGPLAYSWFGGGAEKYNERQED